MAIVADLSGNGGQSGPQDKSFTYFNRANAGTPNAALTPQYVGEIVLDITNHNLWKAERLTNDSWIALTAF